jgi:hypothetical protein
MGRDLVLALIIVTLLYVSDRRAGRARGLRNPWVGHRFDTDTEICERRCCQARCRHLRGPAGRP